VRRLTPEELTSCRERDLCFTCDEKYHRGHCCASRVLLLILEEDEPSWVNIEPGDPNPAPDPPDSPSQYQAQINLNSLSGYLALEALRLTGLIFGHHVTVLVDGGSTHNFVQPQVATQLGLPCRQAESPLRVMVGNDQYLECTNHCEDVSVVIQDTYFTLHLYILPISGANIVFSVQWLKTLGPVLTNYNTLAMQFFYQDCLVVLQGEHETQSGRLTHNQLRRICHHQSNTSYFHITMLTDPLSSPTNYNTLAMQFFYQDRLVVLQGEHETQSSRLTHNQLRRIFRHQSDTLYFHITMLTDPLSSLTNSDLPPEIQHLLHKFELLFHQPQTLPPARTTDHHIHLLPHSLSVNIRPYQYPHYQKQEIEAQVDSMLQKGLIQPSTRPFSSSVLLVHKSDGTWQFCVDYRSLNVVTIRD